MEKALRLMQQGQKQEALSRLKQVVAGNPGNVDAAIVLAQWLASEGQLRRAETILFEQVARHPAHGKAHMVLAELLRVGKRYDDAESHYRHALRLLPEEGAVAYNLGLMLQLANRHEAAVQAYEEACRRAPSFAPAVHNLATIKLAAGDLDGAEAGFTRVLEIDAKHLNARYNLGRIAERRGQPAEAETRYVEVLRLNGNHADALHALGSLLLRHNRNLEWAEKCLKAYIRQQPQSAIAYNELGVLLGAVGRADEAIPCFEAAIEFSPIAASTPARQNLVNVLVGAGRITDAISRLEEMAAIWPDNGNTLLELIRLKLASCQWDRLPVLVARLAELSDEALPDGPSPYPALAVPGLAADVQFRIARRNAARLIAHDTAAGSAVRKPRKRSARALEKCLRIGYLFSDLDDLVVSEALVEVIRHHDTQRFEIFAYAFNAADSSESCGRVAAAAREFRALAGSSLQEAADSIRADRLDILVDLNGWINVQHAPILAARPAPVVVSGWVYPASLGDNLLADHVLADAVTVPDDAQEPFAERVLRLPDCHRPATRWPAELPAAARSAAGLADDAFVFCSFAPVYHFNADVFDLWCSVLRDVPGSVLWLADPGDPARQALIDEAGKREVTPDRLIFGAPAHRADHLARLRLADLALDTFPLNAGQATLDALSVGVPVLALHGDRYAGRVSASLLQAAGCGDLAAATGERYRDIARTLATDAGRMKDTRRRLNESIETSALFDAARFTRAFESVCVELAGSGASGT